MLGFCSTPPGRLASLAAALLLTACPAEDPPPATDDSSDSGQDTGTTADGETDPSATSEGDSTTEAEDTLCGNGVIDAPDENCDDGNLDDGDGCSSLCIAESCALAWSWSEPIVAGNPGANETVVDAEGNVYAVGVTENTDNDIWVAKWNPDGSVAWMQTHDSGNGPDSGNGLAVDDNGDVYIAGRVSADGAAMFFARYAGADGAEVWSQTIDSMFVGEDDIGADVALTPSGDLVAAGRMRVGDGDDDAWISLRSAADGSEQWATTWSGVGDGMFSTERVGSVDVSPDGTIWLSVREFVEFDTQEAVLLAFDPDGNNTLTLAPLADGFPHQHNPLQVAAHEGGAYFVFVHGTAPYRAWIYSYDLGGNEQWVLDQDDWLGDVGEVYTIAGLSVADDGRVLIGGDFQMDGGPSGHQWLEAWVAQLDDQGAFVCRGGHMEDDGAPFAPVLNIFSASGGPGGGIALQGRADEGAGVDSWLWTGYFAP